MKIIKEYANNSYRLIIFTYEDTNFLFGYSYNEELPPFLVKEHEEKYVVVTKYIYTTKMVQFEIMGSLIPISFNFGISINDFLKKYIKNEQIVEEEIIISEAKKKRKYTKKANKND